MPRWRILPGGITETTRLDERNRFIPVKIVRYMVGPADAEHGPFMYQVDASKFNADELAKYLDGQAAEILKLFPS